MINAQDARAAFLNRSRQIVDFNEELPGLPELTGQLSIQELSAKDAVQGEKLSKDAQGNQDESVMLGAMVVKSLVTRDTHERIFADNDMDAVAEFGLSVLSLLGNAIKDLSGIGQTAADAAKKNLTQTTDSASPTSSPENSNQVPMPS